MPVAGVAGAGALGQSPMNTRDPITTIENTAMHGTTANKKIRGVDPPELPSPRDARLAGDRLLLSCIESQLHAKRRLAAHENASSWHK
jgi:hypothetical protein